MYKGTNIYVYDYSSFLSLKKKTIRLLSLRNLIQFACKYISISQMEVILKVLGKGQKCHVWCVNKIFPPDKLNATTPSANTAVRNRFRSERPPLGAKRETNSATSAGLRFIIPLP
jgi:hypothetical protein